MTREMLEKALTGVGAGTVLVLNFRYYDMGVAIALRYLRNMRGQGLAISDDDYLTILHVMKRERWERDEGSIEVDIAMASIVPEFITRVHKGLEAVEIRSLCLAEH